MVSFPGTVLTVGVSVMGFTSTPVGGGFSVSSLIFWAISFLTI